MTKSPTESKCRRWIAHSLLLAGVIALGIWAWSVVSNAVFQNWESWVFDREIRGEPASVSGYLAEMRKRIAGELRIWFGTPVTPEQSNFSPATNPPWVIDKDGLIGRLVIPRLHLSAIVREGADGRTLRLALGHIPGTSLPGQNGNVGVAGHRDTLFRDLRKISKNDLILFDTFTGKYAYRVEITKIVRPQDVSVLKAGDHPELTLVTCYPFYYIGSAPGRFIVKARQLSTSRVEPPAEALDKERQDNHPTDAHLGVRVGGSTDTARSSGPSRLAEIARSPNEAGVRKVTFEINKDHSRRFAPGISLGLTGTDVVDKRVNGWMWVMPDRRTIWLRNKKAQEPVIFYGFLDGKERELVITSVAKNSVKGYLLLPQDLASATSRQPGSGPGGTTGKRWD